LIYFTYVDSLGLSMKILGISAFYHDAAAAVLVDGQIKAAAQEERFSRKKNDPSFPQSAICYCLSHTGLRTNELDAIVFYDKPFLKFERLLETYYGLAPRGLVSFLAAMPTWLKDKLYLKRNLAHQLKSLDPQFDSKTHRFLFPEHHLSHAASSYFASSFTESAILVVDGVGEWATTTLLHGRDNRIQLLKEVRFPHSLGLFYAACTYFLGFKINSGEYKMMGLAPYGQAESPRVERYIQLFKREIIDIKPDGSIWLNQHYFSYATGLKMIREHKWEKLLGLPRRQPESSLTQAHCDLSLAIQRITEEAVLLMSREVKKLTGSNNLCLAGGVALNCAANGRLMREKLFDCVFVPPAPGDAGGAIGAALAAYHIFFDQKNRYLEQESFQSPYLGPSYSPAEIECLKEQFGATFEVFENTEELAFEIAGLIAEGNIVGWFQGRMEFGPRALGNRSILADPRNPRMQGILNQSIKFREGFRPFAPVVLREYLTHYFEETQAAPYMSFTYRVRSDIRHPPPETQDPISWQEKMTWTKSSLPAITHADFSARVQTVDEKTNPALTRLLRAFLQLTGCAALVNTSFNVRGEPIVCTPAEAYQCFMHTQMDFLVIENYFFRKTKQIHWKKSDIPPLHYPLD